MNKITQFIIMILLTANLVVAVDFSPQGNINGKNRYEIYNFTNITLSSRGGICLNSSCITDWITFNTTETLTNYYIEDGMWFYVDNEPSSNCTYSSGNWIIKNDECNITENVDLGNNNIYCLDNCTMNIQSNITNFNSFYIKTSSGAEVIINGGMLR